MKYYICHFRKESVFLPVVNYAPLIYDPNKSNQFVYAWRNEPTPFSKKEAEDLLKQKKEEKTEYDIDNFIIISEDDMLLINIIK